METSSVEAVSVYCIHHSPDLASRSVQLIKIEPDIGCFSRCSRKHSPSFDKFRKCSALVITSSHFVYTLKISFTGYSFLNFARSELDLRQLNAAVPSRAKTWQRRMINSFQSFTFPPSSPLISSSLTLTRIKNVK